MGSRFIPFALDSFTYSTSPSYTRAAQEAQFHVLNQGVYATNYSVASKEVLEGWYGGAGWRDDGGQWVSIERRKTQLDRRIDIARRNDSLSQYDASHLRSDFNAIARLEYRYRQGGLSPWELSDLDQRFDRLALDLRRETRGQDYGLNR